MSGVKTLTPERIAEIKAFKNTDFSDCPVLTEEELKKMRPRHPECFKPVKNARRTRLAIAAVDIGPWCLINAYRD